MDEIKKLEHLYKTEKVARKSHRYHAILLVKNGMKISEVASLFFRDAETVAKWVERWDAQHNIGDHSRSGRPRKLSREEEEKLCEIVDENNPEKHGFQCSTWDCTELQILIKEQFGKEMSTEAIRKLLHEKDFSYRKVDYLFTKRDQAKRVRIANEILSLFEQDFEDTTIFFADEISTKLHPKQGFVWTRHGRVHVKTACSHKKLVSIGATAPKTGDQVISISEKNNADAFIIFLKKMLEEVKGNIFLIIDNYPVHNAKKVRAFLAENDRISLKFLPKYSPDLNPIERFWGYIRKKFLNCKSPPTLEKLKELLQRSFAAVSPEKVMKICSLRYFEKFRIT